MYMAHAEVNGIARL